MSSDVAQFDAVLEQLCAKVRLDDDDDDDDKYEDDDDDDDDEYLFAIGGETGW